jgi:hypothetical protein
MLGRSSMSRLTSLKDKANDFRRTAPLRHLQKIIISLSIIRYIILNRMKSVNWVRGQAMDDYEYKPRPADWLVLAAHHMVSLATFGSSGPHASSLFYIVGHKEALEISP